MKTLRYFLIIALLLGIGSATTYSQSRKLTKKGAELEANGLPEEAADYYYKALLDKPDNIDALIGLKRTAPKMSDRKLQAVNSAYNDQDYQGAIDKYNDVVNYQSTIKKVGVELEIGKPYVDKFNECNEILAEQYYISGKSEFDNGNYEPAINDLEKCLIYKSPYKDASGLISQAREAKSINDAEQSYQSGLAKLNSENYRGAYHDFETCLNFKSPYKDAENLKNEALEKGKVRIGIFEFANDTKVYGANGTLYSYVVTNAVNYKSPFIEVVDRDNLQRLLNEQKLGMSGMVDESSAAQAGKVLGLDYVVMGRLINVTQTGGDLTKQNVSAYELYPGKSAEGIDVQKGKPVTYTLYEGSLTMVYEASYQVISVETSKIIISQVASSSESDQVKFAQYNGDSKKLCKISPNDSFLTQFTLSNNMVDQSLFNARHKMKTPEEMQASIIKNLAYKVADGICGQFK
jgi:tetratricopeptide (TPR) repeat protein